MTCCAGSSVSSAAETTKVEVAVASASSSLIVGSVLTSFSNCSSGRSGRIFLPSGPTVAVAAALVAGAFFAATLVAGAFFAGAFFAAAFLAGAAGSAGSTVAAVFFAGALSAAAFLVLALVVLRVVVAATARVPAGMATLMPSELRWAIRPLR